MIKSDDMFELIRLIQKFDEAQKLEYVSIWDIYYRDKVEDVLSLPRGWLDSSTNWDQWPDCGVRDGDYGICNLPEGHPTRWHAEIRDGEVWASWGAPH